MLFGDTQQCDYIFLSYPRYWPWNLLPEPPSPKNDYRRQYQPHCDIIDDSIVVKIASFHIFYHLVFISEDRLQPSCAEYGVWQFDFDFQPLPIFRTKTKFKWTRQMSSELHIMQILNRVMVIWLIYWFGNVFHDVMSVWHYLHNCASPLIYLQTFVFVAQALLSFRYIQRSEARPNGAVGVAIYRDGLIMSELCQNEVIGSRQLRGNGVGRSLHKKREKLRYTIRATLDTAYYEDCIFSDGGTTQNKKYQCCLKISMPIT